MSQRDLNRTYRPFVINLLGVLAPWLFLSRLIASVYRIWLATTLIILVNTVG